MALKFDREVTTTPTVRLGPTIDDDFLKEFDCVAAFQIIGEDIYIGNT